MSHTTSTPHTASRLIGSAARLDRRSFLGTTLGATLGTTLATLAP